ncbi:MAG TPA: universal stress protein [Actinopolymorphaceae bacterium]|jgi:nucleotide-binding universal stress UspA family protein|nr:universal stress protein [Actinopolymorphaceae bacterium]
MIDGTAQAPIVVGVPSEATRPDDLELPVRWAAQEAQVRGAALWLATAYLGRPRDAVGGDPLGTAAHRAVRGLEGESARLGKEYPDLRVAMFARCGTAVGVLGDMGVEAGLIVVGRQGRGRVAEAIHGSVTAGRLRRTSSPVVVVPPSAAYVDRGAPIVVGVGTHGPAAATLGFAYSEAAVTGASVRLVHCRRVSHGVGRMAGTDRDAWEALVRAVEPYRTSFPHVRTSVELIDGHPGEALTKESVTAALVVLGPGRGWTRGWRLGRLGPVGHEVLGRAASPVVLVRDSGAHRRTKGCGRS